MTKNIPAGDPEAGTLLSNEGERLSRLETHNIHVRWAALSVAGIALIALALLECYLLREVLSPDRDNMAFVVLAASPIVAFATIIVFVLLGAFRVSRVSLPVGAAASQVARQALDD